MDTKPKTTGADPAEAAAGIDGATLRKIVIGVVVVLLAAFAFMIWRAFDEESRLDRWDTLEAIRAKHEPAQDPIWENPYSIYNDERMRYIGALEAFLGGQAGDGEDALEPHTKFLLAKVIADHILANPGVLDQEDRAEFYAKATKQLVSIRDDHPDFPLNWTMLSEDGFPSLTRQFIKWLEDNQAWEQKHMLRAVEPTAGVRVLIRTTRGDMLLGLYKELAPTWTAEFLQRAMAGTFDGVSFVEKRDVGDASEPAEHGIRTGGAATRNLAPYDPQAAKVAADVKVRAGALPEESRNRIPFERGIVSAWHSGTDEYDSNEEFLVVTSRSPYLDYKYTPIGTLVDESGFKSLLTADRIFNGDVWRTDPTIRDDSNLSGLLDWLQVPVQIVKVLVYKDGKLQQTSEGASPHRVAAEASERTLSSVKADRYKTDAPAAPSKDVPKKDGDAKDGDADK